MRIGILLTITGFTMIVMSWVVPIGGVMMIFGAICAAVALDEAMPITERNMAPVDARREVPDAA